mgnify:CR=1 FL=1
MDYPPGYVYELMEKGGPTDVREPYFKEAVSEMMRARKLCAIANAKMPESFSIIFSKLVESAFPLSIS